MQKLNAIGQKLRELRAVLDFGAGGAKETGGEGRDGEEGDYEEILGKALDIIDGLFWNIRENLPGEYGVRVRDLV